MNEIEKKPDGYLYNKISRISNINPRFHRVSSMLLDHIIMTIMIVPPIILMMILGINNIVKIESQTFSIIFFFMMFIYINKDFFNAKSPAKRILGYQVINRKTESPANEIQCFIRNLTIGIAWPLEVIVGYINPERRIGDLISNTKVVPVEREDLKSILIDLKKKKFKYNYILIIAIGIIYFYGLSIIMPNVG